MSKKLIFELSIYTDGDWGYDETIFKNYISRYFESDLYEYTFFEDYTTKIRRTFSDIDDGFMQIEKFILGICNTIYGNKSDVENVKEFFYTVLERLSLSKPFWDSMESNTEINIEWKIIEDDHKPIKKIIYED